MSKYIAPELEKEAFNCPNCGAFSHMKWEVITSKLLSNDALGVANCDACNKQSIWYIADGRISGVANLFKERPASNDSPLHKVSLFASLARMIHPEQTNIPFPSKDMPDDVKQDYIEAASIYQKSPRGAAALLRLGLQKLCKHLGAEGKNINTDINTLAQDDKISKQLIKAADIVRITGNNAVHPGTINDEDFDNIAIKLFDLLNIIVRQGITEPKEVDELFNKMPEGPRQAAESRGKPKA
ncbi:TPA: DUF4145 domain-containing protein [Proteus mirabilis]|uniref:DUF4145 domain-containing protein n=1 Tax=Proteus mirabilis TaxID=584 RepID=UPI001B980A04|nr:DUF4145 domain-containing protein [Proteus mirabilis]HBC8686247.1 DUF4145 domain-containing protein [Proteus mirabilis]HEK1791559.1 DUF4145 domain-containing protein [Proteus mirabilis]HEK2142012.1 DUF4145 domain-containing protein [Proteus mirabilis]HEK2927851.1 DUF4145 domain-containing protein [Proteus mirabilis]